MNWTRHSPRVGIIGAGVAGLTTARQLVAKGIDCTVFERSDRVGGVWTVGYSGFGAQVQKELYEFPDFPLPEETPDFTPGETIQRYLEDYARHYGVWERIRLGTTVVDLQEGAADGRAWTLVVRHDDEIHERTFDVVVVAVGLYSHAPHVPDFRGLDRFEGEVMHVSKLRSRDQLTGRKVMVVGFGKSATDAAIESAAVAERTHLVFREPHWPVPQRLLGVLPFKWAMLSRLTSALIPPYYRPSGVERAIHTLGRPLVWLWWRIVELLLIAQHGLGSGWGRRVSLIPSTAVEVDTLGEATMLPRPELYRLLRSGRIDPHRTQISELTAGSVRLADGCALEVDTVVLGTGWETRPGFLPARLRARLGMEDDGCYLYRQMLHPDVPGLAFVGNASTIQNIATYSIQARWLVDLIAGDLQLPDDATMLDDIDRMKAWKRAVMPHSSARGARLLLHMLHYHDQLLADMGVDPRRKKGLFAPFKEVFAPYQCDDYRTVVATS